MPILTPPPAALQIRCCHMTLGFLKRTAKFTSLEPNIAYRPLDELWGETDDEFLTPHPDKAEQIYSDDEPRLYLKDDRFVFETSSVVCPDVPFSEMCPIDAIRLWTSIVSTLNDRHGKPIVNVPGVVWLDYLIDPDSHHLASHTGAILSTCPPASRYIFAGTWFRDRQGYVCIPCLHVHNPSIAYIRLAEARFHGDDVFVSLREDN